MTSIDDVIRLLEAAKSTGNEPKIRKSATPKKKKKKVSSYRRKYSAAFKKLQPKYKTKSGKWKKDGFKRCAAAARRMAKK
tara:strand:+ start:247 stop:486 length:240 start_codon:yes stop_codon:yes gene_type:complete